MSGSGMTDVKPPPASVGQSRVGVHEISEETLEEHRLVRAGGEYVGDEGEARVDLVCGRSHDNMGSPAAATQGERKIGCVAMCEGDLGLSIQPAR